MLRRVMTTPVLRQRAIPILLVVGLLSGCAVEGGGGESTASPTPTGSPTPAPGADFYPVGVGMRWQFHTNDGFTYVMEVVSEGSHQGRASFEMHSYTEGFGASTMYHDVSGDDVWSWSEGSGSAWGLSMDLPPADSKDWTYDLGGIFFTFEWEAEPGSISVPTGVYSGCWRVHNRSTSVTNYTTYCPDIGPVYFVGGSQTGSLESVTGL